MPEHALVQLGQKAVLIRDDRCLILEGSNGEDQWDLPGGRLHEGEKSMDAFRRELEEELGLTDFSFIATVDYDLWARGAGKPTICLVANLITSDQQDIEISFEHKGFRWVERSELSKYTFYSPAMPRMIEKGFDHLELLKNAK